MAGGALCGDWAVWLLAFTEDSLCPEQIIGCVQANQLAPVIDDHGLDPFSSFDHERDDVGKISLLTLRVRLDLGQCAPECFGIEYIVRAQVLSDLALGWAGVTLLYTSKHLTIGSAEHSAIGKVSLELSGQKATGCTGLAVLSEQVPDGVCRQ
jgi:hypothetical protein